LRAPFVTADIGIGFVGKVVDARYSRIKPDHPRFL